MGKQHAVYRWFCWWFRIKTVWISASWDVAQRWVTCDLYGRTLKNSSINCHFCMKRKREKCEKLRYFCNSISDLRKFGSPWLLIFFKVHDLRTARSPHIENRKSAICHDDPNRFIKHIGRPPSWILELNFLWMVDAPQRHVLHHRVKFCGDQSNCKDIAIFRVLVLIQKLLNDYA